MEVSYGKEPFDLRLMCLRLCRNLWKILAVTVVGTLLFGGGYYVKNVVLQPDPGYAASSTYKVEYKENPNEAPIPARIIKNYDLSQLETIGETEGEALWKSKTKN